MNKAAFSLDNFSFNKVVLNFEPTISEELKLNFTPSGVYNQDNGIFELKIIFQASLPDDVSDQTPLIHIQCVADFIFEDKPSFDDLPAYFYRNSIAILFPYVRAFITTVTTQANIRPLILPTMNLSSLEEPLKKATKVIN